MVVISEYAQLAGPVTGGGSGDLLRPGHSQKPLTRLACRPVTRQQVTLPLGVPLRNA